MTVRPVRRFRFLALALAAVLVAGCVSVRNLDSVPLAGEGGGVELRVYASDARRRAEAPGPRHVESLLEHREGESWRPVFRSLDPVWRVEGLDPGRYRVTLPAVLDPEGEPVPIEDARRAFSVRAGRLSRVEANLDHVPRGAIAAGVVGAVIVGAVLHDWIDDLDLPDPPSELLDVAFHLTVNMAVQGAFEVGSEDYRRRADRPPVVTSVFPESDALVAVSRLRIVIALSEPLAAFEPGAIHVVGERSGPLAGRTRWDADRWWLTWEPDEPLPRGEEIRIEVDPDTVRDRAGNPLADALRSSFRTTP